MTQNTYTVLNAHRSGSPNANSSQLSITPQAKTSQCSSSFSSYSCSPSSALNQLKYYSKEHSLIPNILRFLSLLAGNNWAMKFIQRPQPCNLVFALWFHDTSEKTRKVWKPHQHPSEQDEKQHSMITPQCTNTALVSRLIQEHGFPWNMFEAEFCILRYQDIFNFKYYLKHIRQQWMVVLI